MHEEQEEKTGKNCYLLRRLHEPCAYVSCKQFFVMRKWFFGFFFRHIERIRFFRTICIFCSKVPVFFSGQNEKKLLDEQ